MPTRRLKTIVPAVLGLALASSLLVAPAAPATAAAPTVLTAGTSKTIDSWQQRLHAKYKAYRRHCSAPKAANSTISGENVTLVIKKQKNKTEIARAKAAGCSKSLIAKGRVYSNAMVSTENQAGAMIKAGQTKPTIVEARIKFPRAKGMHGGVWIQSEGNRGPEIDLIESYGTRVTHVHHRFGPRDLRGYKSLKRSASWYQQEHTFKVAFTTSAIVYSIDGVVTNTLLNPGIPAETHFFLVASLLSSDRDLTKINNKKLSSAKMVVRWVRFTQGH